MVNKAAKVAIKYEDCKAIWTDYFNPLIAK